MRPAAAILLLFAAAALSSASPPPSFPTDKAAAEALDAPDFLQREKAARHLWLRGAKALPLLEKLARGEAESSLRAQSIAENIRLGITPDSPSELAELVRKIHGKRDYDKIIPILDGVLRQKGGVKNVLALVRHQSDSRPDGWNRVVAASAGVVSEVIEPSDSAYTQLLAAVQGDAFPEVFRVAEGFKKYRFAYDALTYAENPSQRLAPERRSRVLEELAKIGFAPDQPPFEIITHHQRSLEAKIALAEKKVGDPTALPALLEKLLGSSQSQNADSLTASLLEQDLLPSWIEKYKTLAATPHALDHIHMALAQFLRAAGRHHEAHESAQSHARSAADAISFAFLAGDWSDAESVNERFLNDLGERASDFEQQTRKFLRHIRNPNRKTTLGSRIHEVESKQYFMLKADPATQLDMRFSDAASIAPVSPCIARKLLGGVSFQALERNRGSMGPYLRAKRILGEEDPVIDYISARFATMTSEFWEEFLEKYFAEKSPLWIMLHIRSRKPHLSREALFHETLTRGTAALVADDILNMFEEFKSITDTALSPSDPDERLAHRIRSALGQNRFPSASDKIGKWESSLPPNDWRRGLLIPKQAPADGYLNLHHGESWEVDPEEDRKTVLTSLSPNPFALLRLGAHELKNNRPSEAARLLALAHWITLTDDGFWAYYARIDGKRVSFQIEHHLESALGLEALMNGDREVARKRFENLAVMGSMNHHLGAALYHHLKKSGNQKAAEVLFAERWLHLEYTLELAPRDTEICRALATWSKACENQRALEAKAYAKLANTLEGEQAELQVHLTNFDW